MTEGSRKGVWFHAQDPSALLHCSRTSIACYIASPLTWAAPTPIPHLPAFCIIDAWNDGLRKRAAVRTPFSARSIAADTLFRPLPSQFPLSFPSLPPPSNLTSR